MPSRKILFEYSSAPLKEKRQTEAIVFLKLVQQYLVKFGSAVMFYLTRLPQTCY